MSSYNIFNVVVNGDCQILKTGNPILPLSAALFSAAKLQAQLHCKLNFQVVSGTQFSDTKSDTKIVKSKIMALGLTDSTTSMQPLKSAPLICVTH